VSPVAGLDPVDVLLLMAAKENDTPKVEELLAAGANINIADSKGKSPLDLASKQEVKDLLEVREGHTHNG
jgi:ankyrin repeat protein